MYMKTKYITGLGALVDAVVHTDNNVYVDKV